jgi:hypothetical protein
MGLPGVLGLGQQQIDAIVNNAFAKLTGTGTTLEGNAKQIISDEITAGLSSIATQLEDPLLVRIDAITAEVKQLREFITNIAGVNVGGMPVMFIAKTVTVPDAS